VGTPKDLSPETVRRVETLSSKRQSYWATEAALCLVALTMTFAGCGWRWQRTDEFVAGLKCGMTETEIRSYAQAFEGTEVYEPGGSNLPTIVVSHGGTRIGCWLEDGKLRSVEVSWIREPSKLKEEPRRNLCAEVSK
jgi:hypothetical protein